MAQVSVHGSPDAFPFFRKIEAGRESDGLQNPFLEMNILPGITSRLTRHASHREVPGSDER